MFGDVEIPIVSLLKESRPVYSGNNTAFLKLIKS